MATITEPYWTSCMMQGYIHIHVLCQNAALKINITKYNVRAFKVNATWQISQWKALYTSTQAYITLLHTTQYKVTNYDAP